MITVGVKALNEEKHIAHALSHALKAVEPFSGRVVLADSGSTDRTIAIARQFPVQIVRLANLVEQCCGAGAQLAFQCVDTEFFYIQDGDMRLHASFLPDALRYLRDHPDVAAVGGHVVERFVESEEFEIRVQSQQAEPHRHSGLVDRLDGGGLYRVEAVREAGFFADRNLHAFEEFDLAARLNACGWKLARIDMPAVDHFGHLMSGYRLMWLRCTSGQILGSGEVLRAALGKKHCGFVLSHFRHFRHAAAVIAWWAALLASAMFMVPVLAALFCAPLMFLWRRRRSLRLAIYSAAYWNLIALGLIVGFVRRRVRPTEKLDALELTKIPKSAGG